MRKVFIERAMSRFGVPLEPRKTLLIAHVHALEAGLKERLAQRNLTGSVRLAMAEPAPSGTELLTRTHPLTATLAEALVEASLDPEALSGLGIGRVGAWPTAAVSANMTRLALLRIRFKLTVHARKERLLLAEEAALVAIAGRPDRRGGEAARALLNTPATPTSRRRPRPLHRQSQGGSARLLDGPLAEFVRSRAEELMQDHARLRAAAGSASRVTVEAVLPPDVIGLFVLMPSEV
jgi:hypothetical protein